MNEYDLTPRAVASVVSAGVSPSKLRPAPGATQYVPAETRLIWATFFTR